MKSNNYRDNTIPKGLGTIDNAASGRVVRTEADRQQTAAKGVRNGCRAYKTQWYLFHIGHIH